MPSPPAFSTCSLASSVPTKSWAWVSEPNFLSAQPQAASEFQCAPPEVLGLGVDHADAGLGQPVPGESGAEVGVERMVGSSAL
jgi:hypothetical protein